MSKPDYTALERLASAAGITPGHWFSDYDRGSSTSTVFSDIAADRRDEVARGCSDEDARYIAAASPDVVLALLAERDRLRTALNRMADFGPGLNNHEETIGELHDRIREWARRTLADSPPTEGDPR